MQSEGEFCSRLSPSVEVVNLPNSCLLTCGMKQVCQVKIGTVDSLITVVILGTYRGEK